MDAPKARRRDRLIRAVLLPSRAGHGPRSAVVLESAKQSNSKSSEPTNLVVVEASQATAPNPTTAASSTNVGTAVSTAPPRDTLWEEVLAKLEQSSSVVDRRTANTLREFARTQSTGAGDEHEVTVRSGHDMIEDLKRAVDAKCKETEERAWKIHIGSRTIIMRDVVARVIDCLNKFKEIGDLAVQYDPVHAALPWAAFRFLLQAVTLNKEQTGQIFATMDAVTYAYLRASIYVNLYSEPSEPGDIKGALKSSTADLLAAICGFLALAIKHYSSGPMANVAHGLLNPEAVAKCIDKMAETEAQVEKNAAACKAVLDHASRQTQSLQFDKLMEVLAAHTNGFGNLWAGLTNVQTGLKQLVQALDENKIGEILTWVSSIP